MTDIKETLAKWEAEIRGNGWHFDGTGLEKSGGEWEYEYQPATPHDDYAAGTNWWIEQLQLGAIPTKPFGEWLATAEDVKPYRTLRGASRREAIVNAIEAAARAWADTRKAGAK